jgi:hypothetical protein
MEFVRRLPASSAAPELAGPVVDLATGNRVPHRLAGDLRILAGDLLTEVVTHVDIDTIELRIRLEPDSVRLEVRGEAEGVELSVAPEAPDGEQPEALVRIDHLADRWGLSHQGRDYCLWAEKLTDP